MLESALARAEETLPDRQHFGLDAEQWTAFLKALDAPPPPPPEKAPAIAECLRAAAEVTESLRIELRREHNVDSFDCGQEPLNRFLVRFALQNQQAEASQTYVAVAGDEVVGFYTLVVAQIEYNDAPARLAKGLARHPIPLMLLARLAIARDWRAEGSAQGC